METAISLQQSQSTVDFQKPTDFEKFVPWACKKFTIDVDVNITKTVQKPYVGATLLKKISLKGKIKPKYPSISSDRSSSYIHTSLFGKTKTVSENKIMIETCYNINDELIHVKFLKNKYIPRKLMKIIALTIPYQKYLTSVTINGGLRMDSLYELSKILPSSRITEICLDGTFLSKANYYILLTHANSNLKHLSLARCSINDTVVQTIADQLGDLSPASKVLSILNLSTNRITDTGAKYLAVVLRTNRQLSYLNLAGNMITDEGGVSILETLQPFPLSDQELLESRARYVAYLKKRDDLVKILIAELHIAGPVDKTLKKKGSKKSKVDNYSQPHIDETIETQIIQEKAEYLAEQRMGLFNEPFCPKYTETKNGLVYCFGNNTLCYLNLAYNNLTFVSLKKLHEVLTTQRSRNRTPKGLIKVVIDGNLIPVACEEFQDINRLLEPCPSVIKKKTLSARSHTKQ